jgi:dephospho-CoA kinase
MPVIGLTGNIASGKTHIAEIFKSLGAAVQNSDSVAHQIIDGAAKAEIAKSFPAALEGGKINRALLAEQVFADEKKLKLLEKILHPLVRRENEEFIAANKGKMIVLEMPLLFETGAEKICDYSILVHTPPEAQKARALAREGISEERLKKILKRQTAIPLEEKMQKADFMIHNRAEDDLTAQVKQIISSISR